MPRWIIPLGALIATRLRHDGSDESGRLGTRKLIVSGERPSIVPDDPGGVEAMKPDKSSARYLAGGEGSRKLVTPAEHGQVWTIHECRRCGYRGLTPPVIGSASSCRSAHEVEAIEVVPAADNRALEESAAEFEAKFEQAAAEAETLEAERRALVEALREIANWDYGGQPLRCNEMAQVALDRIGAGR